MPNTMSYCYAPPLKLESNSDIGGIGVLIGFMGTAWIVILFVVMHFVLVVDPRQNPFEEDFGEGETSSKPAWEPNYADEAAVEACLWLRRQPYFRDTEVLKTASRKVILALADIQLLTGIAILFSGYVNLFNDEVNAYHWQLLVYLVWFSNLTHISCLTALRGYLHQHRGQGRARVVLMSFLWLGLLVALGPTVWFDWKLPTYPNEPDLRGLEATSARCFYDSRVAEATSKWRLCERLVLYEENLYSVAECMAAERWKALWDPIGPNLQASGSDEFGPTLISICLTILTYFTRLAKMISPLSLLLRSAIRKRLSGWVLRKMIKTAERPRKDRRCANIWRKTYFRLQVCSYLISSSYIDLATSDVSDTFWLLVSGTWGTFSLLRARRSINIEENTWDFGQILPVFLLVGPLIVIIGSMLSKRDAAIRRGEESPNVQPVDHLHQQLLGSNSNQQELGGSRDIRQTYCSQEQDITDNSAGVTTTNSRPGDALELQLHGWTQNRDGTTTSNAPRRYSSILSRTGITRSEPLLHGLPFAGTIHQMDQSHLEVNELRDLLRTHFKDTRWMRQITTLAGLQFVPFAVRFFMDIFGLGNLLAIMFTKNPMILFLDRWRYVTIASQPVLCFYGVLFLLSTSPRHILRREFLCFPGIWWLLLATSMTPYVVYSLADNPDGSSFAVVYVLYSFIPCQFASLVPITCLWMLGSGWIKWHGT